MVDIGGSSWTQGSSGTDFWASSEDKSDVGALTFYSKYIKFAVDSNVEAKLAKLSHLWVVNPRFFSDRAVTAKPQCSVQACTTNCNSFATPASFRKDEEVFSQKIWGFSWNFPQNRNDSGFSSTKPGRITRRKLQRLSKRRLLLQKTCNL